MTTGAVKAEAIMVEKLRSGDGSSEGKEDRRFVRWLLKKIPRKQIFGLELCI